MDSTPTPSSGATLRDLFHQQGLIPPVQADKIQMAQVRSIVEGLRVDGGILYLRSIKPNSLFLSCASSTNISGII